MNYIIFTIFFLTAIISLLLAIYIYINKDKIRIKGFLGLIVSVCIYSLFYSLEIIAPDIEYMKVFVFVQYIGILCIPAFWIIMAINYTNKKRKISIRFYIALFIIPFCLMILKFTDSYHNLFYASYGFNIKYGLHIAEIEPGIGYIISVIYVNIAFLVGNIIYVYNFINKKDSYRRRSFILMISSFIPWVGYWIYMLDILDLKLDINPIFLSILCLFYAYALFNSDIFGAVSLVKNIIFDDITEGVIVIDKYNEIIEINKKCEDIFNLKKKNILGRNIDKVFSKHKEFLESINIDKGKVLDVEINVNKKTKYIQCNISNIEKNNIRGKMIILIDNTERHMLNRKLMYYGTMDILTGVYNRNYFYDLARKSLKNCYENNENVSLIMFDLDKFKSVNDTYGHQAGDLVLKDVLKKCKEIVGNKYIIGRYGGEEFVILLEYAGEELVFELAERLRKEIETLDIIYEDKAIKITSSFGIYTSVGENNIDILLKHVDEALYMAKKAGRNRVCKV